MKPKIHEEKQCAKAGNCEGFEPVKDAGFASTILRPDVLALIGGFIVTVVTIGIAWGVLSAKVDDGASNNQTQNKLIEDQGKLMAKDHDILISLNQRVIYIQNLIERSPAKNEMPTHNGGHLTSSEINADENNRP